MISKVKCKQCGKEDEIITYMNFVPFFCDWKCRKAYHEAKNKNVK